jgi:signal transduction histidine kinase/CheY-like chemotaxis protein
VHSQGLLPFPTLPAALRYTIALASVGIVYLADYVLGPLIDDGSLFLLLGIAVMLGAWIAGTGPALAATVVSAVLGAADPAASNVDDRATPTHLALFVVQGLLLTAVVSELRASHRLAEQKARDAHDARRESEAAARMKDEFLATVSHELRTPLNAVLGWVHLLRTAKLDPLTWARGLESVERNVRVQAQLTANLLDVSKTLTGTLRLHPRCLSMTDVVTDATNTARPAARAKGVKVTAHLPSDPVPVLGDPARLHQIVWHLLANAIKFTPKGGDVGVAVEKTPDSLVLTVRDSGSGIAPEFLPYVFDRFTQEDSSPTRAAGGLGVGLSLVRELVEMHGGEIKAANRADRTGALFSVTLPRQPDAALEPFAAAATVSPSSPPLDGLRVLVLDRDPEGREVLRAVLQQHGVAVRTVASVAEALEALEAWRPDALITDSATPAHDSYALVGKVQWLEADRGGRIPAAALTAYARTDDRVRRMLDAVQRDLPKPIEPALLTAEIARLTGRERRRATRVH